MQIFVDILNSDAICICLYSLPLTKNRELARQMVRQNYYQRLSGKYAILKTFKNVITLIQGSINTVTYCAITVKVTLLQYRQHYSRVGRRDILLFVTLSMALFYSSPPVEGLQ